MGNPEKDGFAVSFKVAAGGVTEVKYYRISQKARDALQEIIEQGKVYGFVEANREEASKLFSALAQSKKPGDRDLLASALREDSVISLYHSYRELDEVTAWIEQMDSAQRAVALSGEVICVYREDRELDKVTAWIEQMDSAQRAVVINSDAIWGYWVGDKLDQVTTWIGDMDEDTRNKLLNKEDVERQLTITDVDVDELRKGNVTSLESSDPTLTRT